MFAFLFVFNFHFPPFWHSFLCVFDRCKFGVRLGMEFRLLLDFPGWFSFLRFLVKIINFNSLNLFIKRRGCDGCFVWSWLLTRPSFQESMFHATKTIIPSFHIRISTRIDFCFCTRITIEREKVLDVESIFEMLWYLSNKGSWRARGKIFERGNDWQKSMPEEWSVLCSSGKSWQYLVRQSFTK